LQASRFDSVAREGLLPSDEPTSPALSLVVG
jgi:hypothetical protein